MEDKKLKYTCLQCGAEENAKDTDPRKDGRVCKQCGGHSTPLGYVIVGVDLAKSNDYTAIGDSVIENK